VGTFGIQIAHHLIKIQISPKIKMARPDKVCLFKVSTSQN